MKALRFHAKPEVRAAEEFLNIVGDFRDPKEAIREAVSNALDWGAQTISVEVLRDQKRPDEELIIKIQDDGVGLDKERLKAFFDLGHSTAVEKDELGRKITTRIGEKGHGTKTFFNSRQIEVFSQSPECTIEALMNEPLLTLHKQRVPGYDYDLEEVKNTETGTTITILGYNNNKTRDFEHNLLKDYLLWFTKFGSVEKEFGIDTNKEKSLKLKGLGASDWEAIKFGHIFPSENSNIKNLRAEVGTDWTRVFVKRWCFPNEKVGPFPGVTFDLVFYLEGNQAKLGYNTMIRRQGVTPLPGMYTVEDRYGLYVCKDYMPIQRMNEWISTGQQEWTKYHAFVNCQTFSLTANRGNVGNTRPDLLEAIGEAVRVTFEEKVRSSSDFQAYEDEVELEKRYRSAKAETADFNNRFKAIASKKVATLDDSVELLQPRREAGVLALFVAISALHPGVFPFRIVDYDTAKGYDAVCTVSTALNLAKDELFFVEFKYLLKERFDHSFDKLAKVVCWDCAIGDGTLVEDLVGKKRTLKVSRPTEETPYTQYMLVTSSAYHNIEVFVLKDYLKEKLGIEFKARSGTPDKL